MKNKFSTDGRASLVNVTKKTLPIVVRELKRIEKEAGVITPATVIEQARSEHSPLYPFFTWDNDEAARKFREWQARVLISCVKVTFKDSDGEELTVRAFVNVPPEEADNECDLISEGGYISIDKASRNVNYKSQVIQYAYNQAVNWKKRFGGFKEFFAIAEAIEKTKV